MGSQHEAPASVSGRGGEDDLERDPLDHSRELDGPVRIASERSGRDGYGVASELEADFLRRGVDAVAVAVQAEGGPQTKSVVIGRRTQVELRMGGEGGKGKTFQSHG